MDLQTKIYTTFGSWDAALVASGFDPIEERVYALNQEWDIPKVVEKLQEFALAKREEKSLQMSNELRSALKRRFNNLKAACKAAGLGYEEINTRALYQSPKVANVVKALRKLEMLKGKERRDRLRKICTDPEAFLIIRNHYTSLQRLAKLEGLDPRVVSNATYRDEADVHHDLDKIAEKGEALCYTTLKRHNMALYQIISKTGWARERLVSKRL